MVSLIPIKTTGNAMTKSIKMNGTVGAPSKGPHEIEIFPDVPQADQPKANAGLQPDLPEKPLTVQQAADYLSHSPTWIRQQIKNGTIKATKHGRKWFVHPEAITQLLKYEIQVK